jgi:protein-tyrosine-phosphatase
MRERGIDLSGRRSKHLSEFAEERWDFVVSLCDRVREVCPEFPEHPHVVHWSVAEPARDDYAAFQRLAAELERRLRFFLHTLPYESPVEEVG